MVSIIVTHRKWLLYLKDCFKSISEQEFKDYETVLVVDDLQDDKDEFQQVIDEYKDKINLKIFYLEGKTGVSAARNLGMDKAQGEYIYFLDNDDYIYDDGIKKLLDVMDEDTDMAYGRVQGTYQGTVTFEERNFIIILPCSVSFRVPIHSSKKPDDRTVRKASNTLWAVRGDFEIRHLRRLSRVSADTREY